jgi:hypothetical protein
VPTRPGPSIAAGPASASGSDGAVGVASVISADGKAGRVRNWLRRAPQAATDARPAPVKGLGRMLRHDKQGGNQASKSAT